MKAIIILFLVLSQSVIAQNETIFIDKSKGHYTGELDINNIPNGRGELIFLVGGSYLGDWKNGQFHGNGILTYINGDIYRGDFKKGLRHGSGLMTWTDTSGNLIEYTGNWKKGLRHGFGLMTWTDTSGNLIEYAGNWKKGNMHGKGKIKGGVWGEGWEGRWKRNIRKKGNSTTFVTPREDQFMFQ